MKSISFRLTLWYGLAATLSAGVFLLVGQYMLERSYVEGIDDLNDKEFEEIGPRIQEVGHGDIEAVIRSVLSHTEIDASLYFFQIERSDGSVFFTSSNLGGHHLPDTVHGVSEVTVFDEELGWLRVSEYEVAGYVVHIGSSLQGWNTLNKKLVRYAGLILGLVFLTSLGIGYFLSRLALNPIANIEKTASRIGIGNLSERIEVPRTKDEIASMTVLLNELFDRLENAVLQAQRFAADASHELKTPLSLLRLRVENLLGSEDVFSEAGRDELVGQLEDIENLGTVVDELLLLSKSEAGVLKQNIVEHSVGRFIDDFALDAQALCEDKGVSFVVEEKVASLVPFDEMWIRHTFFNLLSNSLKVSDAGTTIELESSLEDGYWLIGFSDQGPGIEESKLCRIFDRFYSEQVGAEEPGSGLGLALCRSIVAQHRGSIRAMNRKPDRGLRIEIRLPLGKPR
ncbi:HAMP domain-containing sensor histidine kinase [Pelagicoccus albus]|uniref:histidine kinase n=1 Tax=Pelagicoccus albus TaxID=415222 RepID=A0A7X1B7J7_9BACT|nr:HAMP domain-containing sensor histidine kinase [Pelagicoccus albus]MBC2607118.1 HAMP domain-containing histidine kinase [Pelagicoccus albus]